MKNLAIFPLIIFTFSILSCKTTQEKVSLKNECFKTMTVLTDALYERQINELNDPDYGAIKCESCGVLHTRAAEAVYPFAVRYKTGGEEIWAKAAIDLGNWLIKQQLAQGEWKETPEEWTGTTTDQLLMMLLAYPLLKEKLSSVEQNSWELSMQRAADYLTKVMSPDFASINYCATTCATLAIVNLNFPQQKYADKARVLARQVISKMNEEGFICGEGDRVFGVKYGADVGYEIDMSLWGLAIYARTTGDTLVERRVKESLKNHLYFVYPNGAIDGSWGIRSNKWCTFGSETADGCQILFSYFAEADPRYMRAGLKNLNYLNGMINSRLIGYGPQYFELFEKPPCIYPTFARSKNLAMAVEIGTDEFINSSVLPSEEQNWFRYFPTVDVTLVRTKEYMTTVTAYGYQELRKRNKSKYMHRPSGGAISNLWVEDHGFLQISSQTEYHRWEPMHFPQVGDVLPLTPRIEFVNENGYFTNLYEFDGNMLVKSGDVDETAIVKTFGELRNRTFLPGGVAYSLEHKFRDNVIEKTVNLRYHDGARNVRIVEPIVYLEGMSFEKTGTNTVKITAPNRTFEFRLLVGNAHLSIGDEKEKYWAPFPSIKAFPITLHVNNKNDNVTQSIKYEIAIYEK